MIIKSQKLRNQKAIKFKNITFQAVDWASSDVFVDREDDEDSDADSDNGYKKYKKRDKLLQIRVYGLTKSGVSVCCLIEGFKPFFYIKLPNTWTTSYLKAFSKKLRKKLGKKADGLVSIQKIKRKEYYGFTNDVYQPFVEIIFNNMAAYYEAKRIIHGKNDFDEDEEDKPMFISIGGKKINISDEVVMYETNISPLLRFFHDKDIKPAGWLKVTAKSYKEVKYHTTCQINIKCNWTDIIPVDKNDIAPMMIASFDIECTSDDGSFPNPFKDTDEIIQIGTTIHKYGSKECCYKRIDTLKFCNDIDETDVVCYRRERDMVLGWAKFIKEIGPEIITGYNIWGFDMKYIYDRANKYGYYKDLKLMLSKINDQPTWDTDFVKGAKWKEKKLASSALGDNFLKYFEIEGMVGIDLFKLVQKDHNLDSYKLDNVSKVFIRGNITNYESCENGMKLYTNNIDALTVEQWISIEFKTKRKNLKGDHRKKYKVIELNVKEKWFIIKDFKFDGLFIDECMEDAVQGNIKSIWFQNKNDLPPTTLFDYYKDGSPDKITEIAKYCVKDCELCNLLIIKLDVITANIGQANVCIVPFSYLFLRGQGVKIFSLVAKQCRIEEYMVKTIRKEDVDSSGYEGAIVFKPNPGIYFEPVAVMDYASLYPSSMIAENISHDTLLMIKEYDNDGVLISETGDKSLLGLDDYNYNDIEYDVYEGVGDDKMKVGYKVCTFVEKKSGEKGVLPRILMKLLKARRDTRKMIKYKVIKTKNGDELFGLLKEKDDHYEIAEVNKDKNIVSKDDMVDIYDKFNDFEKMMLDALQKAYKVVCNSLYGQVGATTSPMCMKELAACTTATGRKMVTVARDITLENYEGSRLVYGDSVVGDEPLLLQNEDGSIVIKTIETLSNEESEWKSYDNFKPFDSNRTEKQQSKCKYKVWSNGKWNVIKKVIRHKTFKNIYRVNTHTGVVDVTEDHSLLNSKGEKLKPKDCIINETKLLQSYPEFNVKPLKLNEIINILDKYDNHYRTLEEKEAFVMGCFYGDGSCGLYNYKSGKKYSWAINNTDLKLLNMCKIYLQDLYSDYADFKILETMKSSGVRKLVPKGSIKFMVDKFRDLFYDKDKYKIVPNHILNSDYNVRLNFFLGYYAADGYKARNSRVKNISFDNKGKIGSAHLYYIAKSLGYKCSIRIRKDKMNIYRITCCTGSCPKTRQRKESDILKKLEIIRNTNNNEYVYDLETEDGQFGAGIGEIIVKNTDSVFISFKDYLLKKHGEMSDEELLKKTIDAGVEAGALITDQLKRPQELEYEKTFYPFIIFSKKRYVGNKYEFNTKKYKQTSMGIVLKRRDNAPIVKEIYGGVIDMILNKRNIDAAKEYFKKDVKKLLKGDVDIYSLIISKSIRAMYSNPTQIAHKVLADRMGDRDPGNKPKSNDRIPYCYIDKSALKCKICNAKVTPKNCKCVRCMNIYCSKHLFTHRKSCLIRCRYYKRTNEEEKEYQLSKAKKASEKKAINKRDINSFIKMCKTCHGWYSDEAMILHNIRTDKYGRKHHDKCKKKLTNKVLQGDIIEHPDYIMENNLKMDYRYYLEHQIEKPVMQIFGLTMDNPKKLIEDILVDDDHRKNGTSSITNWFKKVKSI